MSGPQSPSSSSLPPLSAEERAARDARLQREHESYIRGIATMRSLPRLRSTIAGAGGKTNTITRIAEEREEMRQQHLRQAAEMAAGVQRRRSEHQSKVEKLASAQARKRQRRKAKQEKRKARQKKARTEALEGHSSHSSSSENSEDDSASASSSVSSHSSP